MVAVLDVLATVLHLVLLHAQMAAIQVVLVALVNVQKTVPTTRILHVQDVQLNVQKHAPIITTTQVALLAQIVVQRTVQENATTTVIKDVNHLAVEHVTTHAIAVTQCVVLEVKQLATDVEQNAKVAAVIPAMATVMEI